MVCNQQNWKSCLELKKIYDADVTMTTLCDVTVTQFNGKQFYFRKAYLWQVLVIMINILFKTRFFDVLSITQFDILRVSDKCLKIQLILTDIIFNTLKNITFKSTGNFYSPCLVQYFKKTFLSPKAIWLIKENLFDITESRIS